MQRLLLHTAAWIVALAIVGQLVFAVMQREGGSGAGDSPRVLLVGASDAPPSAQALSGDTVIERDASGQFHLSARINDEETRFLVDTGADIVALTVDEADRLGLNLAPEDFWPIMRTASGVGNGAPVRLERIELGGQEFRDVGAVVVEGLEVNLLGQSVLRRFGSVELQGDRMVIRHQ